MGRWKVGFIMKLNKILALTTCAVSLLLFATPVKAASSTGVVTVNYKTPIAVWREPGRNTIRGKTLANHTAWRYFRIAEVKGQVWYNLGGQQWVPAEYVTVNGQKGSENTSRTTFYEVVQITKPVNVYTSPNGKITSRILPFDSYWRSFATRYDNNSHQWWYNLGGSQWVPQFSVNSGQDPQIGFASFPVRAGSVVTVTNRHGAKVYSFDGYLQKATGKVLPYGSRWRAFTGVNHGVPTIGVGGNQFVYADEVSVN